MKNIELDTPIAEMDEDSLRATFADVMAAHEENIAEYDALSEQFSDLEADLEAEQETVGEAATYFAEKAESVTTLDADLLVDRFNIGELIGMAARADEQAEEQAEAEFAEEDEGDEEGEEGVEANMFADRPDRAPTGGEAADYSEEAKSRLARIPGLALD